MSTDRESQQINKKHKKEEMTAVRGKGGGSQGQVKKMIKQRPKPTNQPTTNQPTKQPNTAHRQTTPW